MSDKSDAELIEGFKAGQIEGFNEIVKRYQQKVYWVARRILGNHEDADDVVQDVFLKTYEALKNFRGDSNLFTWLYRITINVSLNNIRKQKFKKIIPFDELLNNILHGSTQADEPLLQQEYNTIIENAIARLPAKQRAVFTMRYYDEMTFEDIARILKKSVGGTKANYFHAVRSISKYVNKEYEQ